MLVGLAGWIALYAVALFPEQANYAGAAYDGSPRRTPWTHVVMACGPQLLVLALIMLAVLVAVPRLWQEGPAEEDHPGPAQATGKPSVRRGAWFGAGAVAAGLLALFAAALFPPVETARTRALESLEGYVPPWSELMQYVASPLLLAGWGSWLRPPSTAPWISYTTAQVPARR
ncbi:hypothetical protein AOC05_13395 [Arthrobacter alpinus]|uniref:Uncharacterized protein n=1 Tax=Arthrobacter alpinus TaxID=656366 RepID=A0A0M4QZT7_9MICC|nr:hypothetical protein [Arthrobacter alpinus]ALE93077.1 hypothetical protein AOC05_13395 [Arthrobacter alpinus]